MLRLKNKKAQSTAEYVIVLGLVIGAVVAMQTYIKRGLQGKIRGAVDYNDGGIAGTGQYEPYYLSSNFDTTQTSNATEGMSAGGAGGRTSNETQSRTGGQKFEKAQ